jgi:hypothetical protein
VHVLDWLRPSNGWTAVSRGAAIGWGLFYAVFLVYAATDTSGFLILDHANLMFHEAGHALFSWAGYYTHILGGTIGQLLLPMICALAFVRRGETAGAAFCAFWFFENLLYVAAYMADARRSALPLVGSDESDWTILFTHWGVLGDDRTIASIVRGLGWMGMLAAVAWFVWMAATRDDEAHPRWTAPCL